MAHPIVLSDATFASLQKLAQPFVDTPESLIAKLAEDELNRRHQLEDDTPEPTGTSKRRLDPDSHESLTHARLMSATVDGHVLHRPKWNTLLNHLHVVARQRLGSFDAVRHASSANIRAGRYEENGFQYLPSADLSVQGVDANLAWNHSLGLARQLQIPIDVSFEWRNKEGAARPGESGVLAWAPSSLSVA